MGRQIEVAINVDLSKVKPPNDKLGSFTGSLKWDPAVLAYKSDTGILAGFMGVVNTAKALSGQIALNGVNTKGAAGQITVLRITFDVVGAGTSALDLTYSAMAAANTFADLRPLVKVKNSRVTVLKKK
jgi:hypothetical protein